MPVALSYMEHVACHKLKLQQNKRFVVVQHGIPGKNASLKVLMGPQEQRDTQKMVRNGKANCSTLLR